MKIIPVTLLLVLSIVQAHSQSLTDMSFVLGSWQMPTKKGIILEKWNPLNDSTLVGESYRLSGKDTVLLEEVQIAKRGGEMFYIPTVQDQNNRQPVFFKLISSKERTFVFENKSHDYPQRVIYKYAGQDSIHAWIEGEVKGKLKRSDYFFSRSAAKKATSIEK